MPSLYWLLIITLPLLVLWALFWWGWSEPASRLLLNLERRRSGLAQQWQPAGGIHWHLLVGGRGEPLVLLHGFNADGYHFSRVARRLGRHFRLICPDLPGFGLTRTNPEKPVDGRIQAQAERVLELLDRMGIERFYLGGSSMGGYVATAIARSAPERVQALWLLSPGGLHQSPLSPLFENLRQHEENALVVRNRKDFDRLMDYCFVRPPWLPSPLRRQLARQAAAGALQAERIFHAMRFDSPPLEALAEGLPTPTLVVWGEADQVLHPAGLNALTRLLPHSRSLLLPATGHLPMLERPQAAAEAWIAFSQSQARR